VITRSSFSAALDIDRVGLLVAPGAAQVRPILTFGALPGVVVLLAAAAVLVGHALRLPGPAGKPNAIFR
jgi:hypothetical protein